MKPYAALIGRVRRALSDLERVVDRAEELAEKASRTGDSGYLDEEAVRFQQVMREEYGIKPEGWQPA